MKRMDSIDCMEFGMLPKLEEKEEPCEHGWVKTEKQPFCHYCEGCCF